MDDTNAKKPSPSTTQELRRSLIRAELSTLLENIGQKKEQSRINFYAEALDDLTPGQIEHGFRIVSRAAGEFWPTVREIREACETWRPSPEPDAPVALDKSHLTTAANRNRVTHDEIAQWLDEGKRAQQEHIDKLKSDPKWQEMAKRLSAFPGSPKAHR